VDYVSWMVTYWKCTTATVIRTIADMTTCYYAMHTAMMKFTVDRYLWQRLGCGSAGWS
jgi:hypothetical protein